MPHNAFDVTIYAVVKVKVADVAALNKEDAIDKAMDIVDPHSIFPSKEIEDGVSIEYGEEVAHYYVYEGPFDFGYYGPGREKDWPDLMELVKEVLQSEPDALPRYMGIHPTVDSIVSLRLQKD